MSRIHRGASAVGVYRLWRDLGYAVGALLAGVIADSLGLKAAMWSIAALTFVSGAVVAVRMTETRRQQTIGTWSRHMAKTLLILNDAPYGSERSYNALRLFGRAVEAGWGTGEALFSSGTRQAAPKPTRSAPKASTASRSC